MNKAPGSNRGTNKDNYPLGSVLAVFSLSHAYKACHFILMMDTLRLTDVLSRLPSRMVDKDIVVLVDIDCPLCTDKKLFLLHRPTGQFTHHRSID